MNLAPITKSKLPLAAISGVVAVILTFSFLYVTRVADKRRLADQESAMTEVIRVATAARDLPSGMRIGPEHIRMRAVPRAYLPPEPATSGTELIGREANADIYAGEVVSQLRLAGEGPKRASSVVKEGKVAVAVGVDEVAGVAGGIRAGDHVDVLYTNERSGGTRALIKNALVLGIGGAGPFVSLPVRDEKGSGAPNSFGPQTVVLELFLEEAAEVTEAAETGELRLALRSV